MSLRWHCLTMERQKSSCCAKIQYLCTLFRGEALPQFDSYSSDVEGPNPINLETIILGLASYFSFEFAAEAKARDALWNEEAVRFKT